MKNIKFTKTDMLLYLKEWVKDNKYLEKYNLLINIESYNNRNELEIIYKKEIYPLFINRLKEALISMALCDIIKASDGGSKMGAFILCSCYIDYLAFYYKDMIDVGKRYKKFVKDFLTNYNPNNLYHDLRCKLVHNYSVGSKNSSYIFCDNNPNNHLIPINNNYQIRLINLENFIEELRNATEELFKLITDNENQLLIAVKRHKEAPLLRINLIEL